MAVITLAFWAVKSGAQTIVLRADPARTSADITLSATLHTVHGKFQLNHGEVHFDPTTGRISGEIAFDATSGKTGDEGRDHKMHKDVLESAKFPRIAFRPDRVDGKVSVSGTSMVQVHGFFLLHGTEHELTVPVEVKLEASRWQATTHFEVPYQKWGLRNPSNFFLHVANSVEVEFHGEGTTGASGAP